MNPLVKFVLVATAAIAVVLLGTTAVAAYVLVHSGTVQVQVHNRSPQGTIDIDLPLPAGLVAGLLEIIAIAPDGDRHHRRDHAWRPAARAACRALADAPDGVLVDIAKGTETVRIRKDKDVLDIRVVSPEEDVHITTPAGLLSHLADVV